MPKKRGEASLFRTKLCWEEKPLDWKKYIKIIQCHILNNLMNKQFGPSTEVWVEHFARLKLCSRGRTLGAITSWKCCHLGSFEGTSFGLRPLVWRPRGRTLSISAFSLVQTLLLSKFGHSLNWHLICTLYNLVVQTKSCWHFTCVFKTIYGSNRHVKLQCIT